MRSRACIASVVVLISIAGCSPATSRTGVDRGAAPVTPAPVAGTAAPAPSPTTAPVATFALPAGPAWPAAPRRPDDGDGHDAFGDPLPVGALARFGLGRIRDGASVGIAFAPDGRWLVTGSFYGEVALWDVATGMPRRTLPHPDDPAGEWSLISSLAVAPDGRQIAAASPLGVVLWSLDAPDRPRLLTRPPAKDSPRHVAWSPDGRLLAVDGRGYDDPVIELIDAATGEVRARRVGDDDGQQYGLETVVFAADGAWAASIDGLGQVMLVRPDGRDAPSFKHPYATTLAIAGDRLITGGSDGVAVWDPGDGRKLRTTTFGRPRLDVVELAVGPDGHTVAVRLRHPPDGSRGEVLLADLTTDRVVRTVPVAEGNLTFSPDGTTLAATANRPDRVALIDLQTGGERGADRLIRHDCPVWSIAMSPDGALVATGSDDGTARLWDATTGAPRALLFRGLASCTAGGGSRAAVAWSPDGTTLAAVHPTYDGVWHRSLDLLDGTTGAVRTRVTLPDVDRAGHAVAWSPDGTRVAVLAGSVFVVDVAAARVERELPAAVSPTWAATLAWTVDGRRLIAGGDQLRVVEVATGAVVHGWTIDGGVATLAVAPDGKTVAVSAFGLGSPVELRDLARGTKLRSWTRPGDGFHALAFSPDGTRLALGGQRLLIVDPARGTTIVERPPPSESFMILGLRWSPDGTRLITGLDHTAIAWDVAGLRSAPVPPPTTR